MGGGVSAVGYAQASTSWKRWRSGCRGTARTAGRRACPGKPATSFWHKPNRASLWHHTLVWGEAEEVERREMFHASPRREREMVDRGPDPEAEREADELPTSPSEWEQRRQLAAARGAPAAATADPAMDTLVDQIKAWSLVRCWAGAVGAGNVNVVRRLLLREDADVNQVVGQTPLRKAA